MTRSDAPHVADASPSDAGHDGFVRDASRLDARTFDGSSTDAPAALVPLGPAGTWTLAWNDEFEGPSIDGSKWNIGWLTAPKSPGHGNTTAVTDSQQPGTYFGPTAFSFPGDGALHIRLSAPEDPGAPAGFTTRESGLITTAGLWNINPGSVSYGGAGQATTGATLPTSATGTPNDLMLDYVRIWTGG